MVSATRVYAVKKLSANDAEYHSSMFLLTRAVKENTHAVVCFDDAVAVVPWKHVTVVESTDSREKCNVMWSDGLSYDGIVIFKGTSVIVRCLELRVFVLFLHCM